MAFDGSLKFDTKIDSTGFSGGVEKLKGTALKAIGAIGAAFATGAIAKALIGQIALVEQYGSAINDQSQKIGITTKAYQELSYIMGQTGGSVDTLQMGIKTLSSAVVDGNKAFEALGISLDDARQMSQEDLFNEVITQLAGMEAGTKRTSLATDLFGRSATELAPLLNMGADGIAKMRKEASDYGLIMSDKAVAATDKYGDAVALAQKSGEALRNAIVVRMLPALTGMAQKFGDVAKEANVAFNERGIAGVVDVITDQFPVATAAVSGLAAAFAALLIIQAVQKGMAAFAVVQKSLTALLVAGTAAEWSEIGALTLKQVIVAIMTKELVGAAAAQALLNATILANPVMLLVAAIGLLVGGVALLSKNYEKLHPELEETKDEIDALSKSIKESKQTYADTLGEIESQERGAESLISTLEKLSAEYSGSRVEQSKMQAIIDELNGAYSGLNLSFDKNTGKLSKNAGAVRDLVAAQIDAAKKTATLNRYVELLSEQQDAEYELRKARQNFYAAGDKGVIVQRQTNAVLKTAQEAYDSVTAEVDDCNVSLTANAEATGEVADAMEDVAEVTTTVIGGIAFTDDQFKAMGMTADDVAKRLGNFSGAAQNMFEKISTKSKVSVKSMIDNLTANTAAIEQWGDNIAYLGSKLPADLLQPLIDQGPEAMAGVLNNLAKASDKELAELTKAFNQGGSAAIKAWYESIGAVKPSASTTSKIAATVKETVLAGVNRNGATSGEEDRQTQSAGNPVAQAAKAVSADNSLNEAVAAAATNAENKFKLTIGILPWAADGENIVNGVIKGIRNRLPELLAMARTMAKNFDAAFRAASLIASPSKMTMQDGEHLVQGIIVGINNKLKDLRGAGSGAAIAATSAVRTSVASAAAGRASSYGGSAVTYAPLPAVAASNTTTVNAPITVQGLVESDAQLTRRITKEFQGVLYGRT